MSLLTHYYPRHENTFDENYVIKQLEYILDKVDETDHIFHIDTIKSDLINAVLDRLYKVFDDYLDAELMVPPEILCCSPIFDKQYDLETRVEYICFVDYIGFNFQDVKAGTLKVKINDVTIRLL